MTNSSYKLHIALVYLGRLLCFFVPKKKDLILFSAWFGKKYDDSSRYMFEFLLKENKYSVKWYTVNKGLYKELKDKGLPVVYGKSLNGIWNQIRARMLVSAIQLYDFNIYFLYKCIFFDLDHGYALKQVGFAIPEYDNNSYNFLMQIRKHIDYWMSAPTKWCMEKVHECYDIDSSRIVKCNKPRTDVLFNESLKVLKNKLVEDIKAGRKAIVWMPTHRSCGEVTIPVHELFDLDAIQEICQKKGVVFIIKKHFYHRNEKEDLVNYPNIYDITDENVDSQVLLSQADALISDYSSSYIEYLIMDRPIILYAYDIDDYLKHERGLYIPLDQNTAGEVVTSKDSLLKSINRITEDWNDSKFAEGRKKARQLYFDENISKGKYSEAVSDIIDELLSGNYMPDWNG